MALKKTIAGYRKDYKVDVLNADGSLSHQENKSDWIEQQDIDMHPLEEAELRAHWAIHDVRSKMPVKPTQQDEHNWLIDFGADYVKKQRSDWQAAYDAMQPALQAAVDSHAVAAKAWSAHIEEAVAKGVSPDIYQGD